MNYIYLDHNATTPTRPEVIEAVARCWQQGLANPASQHRAGQTARKLLEDAREAIAAILGAELSGPKGDRLIFTSGGTEANNLAMLGIARAGAKRAAAAERGQVVLSSIEHSSVIEPAERLMDDGFRVDTLPADGDGIVRAEQLPALLSDRTRLVSVILGNHETGVLQPVAEISAMCRDAGVPLHTDAIQVIGKLPVQFRELGVSALTIAAHKFQGPLGIGALLLRHDVPVDPLLFGGPQQHALRPGTESAALAVGMATALELWQKEQEAHLRHLTALRDRFEAGLRAGCADLVVNGSAAPRLPQTSSASFPGLDAQILLLALDMSGVGCSVGSACASGSTELSPTLLAMGLPRSLVSSTLRFSLGATTTEEDIDEAVRRILNVVRELRS